MSQTKILPFLMFEGSAEAAMNFYLSLFADGKIVDIKRYVAGGPGKEGSVMRASFTIAGQTVMCIDSPMKHAFGFTPSFSLFVDCASEEEIDRLAKALAADGKVLMELGNYGFSRKFAWVNDRFGVSWQVNLP
jgi:predicted 3-demethylubiquinone-9 3-methyltransferase (glyoxalase superfamily)